MKHHVTVYLTDEELKHFKAVATARRLSMARYLRECLLNVSCSDQEPGARAQPVVFDALLHASEQRLIEAGQRVTERQTQELTRWLTIISAMIDRFVLSFLVHTPELPDDLERKRAAMKSGERRHSGWREAVDTLAEDITMPMPRALNDDEPDRIAGEQ